MCIYSYEFFQCELFRIFCRMGSDADFMRENEMRMLHTIYQSSHCHVFCVYSEKYKTKYAIKKIHQKDFNQSEVDTMIAIHNGITVNLYKIYHYNEYVYLMMEYCPSDLDTVIRTTKHLTYTKLSEYIYAILLSVKACHDRNIAHCDIKPTNFLIDEYNRLKIADFGISMCANKCRMRDCHSGTKFFMAPEIFVNEQYDPFASDIWAIGVTIYYLATKNYPFIGINEKELQKAVFSGIYNFQCIHNELLRDLIDKCLKQDPTERPTIYELLKHPFFSEMLPKINPIAKDSSLKDPIKKLSPYCFNPLYSIRKSTYNLSSQIFSHNSSFKIRNNNQTKSTDCFVI